MDAFVVPDERELSPFGHCNLSRGREWHRDGKNNRDRTIGVGRVIGDEFRLSGRVQSPMMNYPILKAADSRAVPGTNHANPLLEATFHMDCLRGVRGVVAGLERGIGFLQHYAGCRRLSAGLHLL